MSTTSIRPTRFPWIGLAGYLALLVGGIGLFCLVSSFGESLHPLPAVGQSRPLRHHQAGQVNVVVHVAATLAAVIGLGFLLGRVFRVLGQPPVIGEILAGILLGPSLLGVISPEAMHLLIPSPSSDPHGQVPAALKAVSQLGVILYMFLVGLELNAGRLATQAHTTVAVSHASIVIPFVFGAMLALTLYPIYSHEGVPFTSFAMFLGVAMAITAFPVLARILTDRGLEKTDLGSVALGCAAADDVTAWCLLALVVGVAQAEGHRAMQVIGGSIAFIALMFLVVRPLLQPLTRKWDQASGNLPPLAVSGTFLAVLLASISTEVIGIHAVFGAFLLGTVIPHDSKIAREFTAKLKDPVTVLLLPGFFAYTGMRTQFSLVTSWEDWMWCGVIILVATAGKFGGTLLASRLNGLSWRDSAALGTLMNTRGLMELIVLNIGLDLGIISPTIFAMMVVMALVTTVATAPIVHFLIPKRPE